MEFHDVHKQLTGAIKKRILSERLIPNLTFMCSVKITQKTQYMK